MAGFCVSHILRSFANIFSALLLFLAVSKLTTSWSRYSEILDYHNVDASVADADMDGQLTGMEPANGQQVQ
jgi:hypothetical protein